jgi:beta-lactam-binding protein with PASTA domain
MPDLIGLTRAEAVNILHSMDIEYTIRSTPVADPSLDNTVRETIPSAGASIRPAEPIVLGIGVYKSK